MKIELQKVVQKKIQKRIKFAKKQEKATIYQQI